jgi:hypothetical protein
VRADGDRVQGAHSRPALRPEHHAGDRDHRYPRLCACLHVLMGAGPSVEMVARCEDLVKQCTKVVEAATQQDGAYVHRMRVLSLIAGTQVAVRCHRDPARP